MDNCLSDASPPRSDVESSGETAGTSVYDGTVFIQNVRQRTKEAQMQGLQQALHMPKFLADTYTATRA
ncbi:uncharacterized protein A1O5_05645 [Cladophialophora psammophila CBS 110553]|uniref:Uncharacterized protein n=1 Tax=Cladophialophora psammophila CBS 110553 TaxID=1182543 RepID=W9X002_9EURO|nr:uncharacterized protein A1O5_05645 [Cladophialophora psammophila CBS 110553]EXJ70655.1 hypothetical protein A1O5_05645 [Cladophialophora psammophila CBS 110553]